MHRAYVLTVYPTSRSVHRGTHGSTMAMQQNGLKLRGTEAMASATLRRQKGPISMIRKNGKSIKRKEGQYLWYAMPYLRVWPWAEKGLLLW